MTLRSRMPSPHNERAMKEIIETLIGQRGDSLDSVVTKRDLAGLKGGTGGSGVVVNSGTMSASAIRKALIGGVAEAQLAPELQNRLASQEAAQSQLSVAKADNTSVLALATEVNAKANTSDVTDLEAVVQGLETSLGGLSESSEADLDTVKALMMEFISAVGTIINAFVAGDAALRSDLDQQQQVLTALGSLVIALSETVTEYHNNDNEGAGGG